MAENIFPVTYSTLASDAIVHQVLPAYDIGQATSCQLWHRGLSDVYFIEMPTTHYVMRVSHAHWRSKAEIAFELELLVFLKEHNIPVASPLITTAGDLYIEIKAPEPPKLMFGEGILGGGSGGVVCRRYRAPPRCVTSSSNIRYPVS